MIPELAPTSPNNHDNQVTVIRLPVNSTNSEAQRIEIEERDTPFSPPFPIEAQSLSGLEDIDGGIV